MFQHVHRIIILFILVHVISVVCIPRRKFGPRSINLALDTALEFDQNDHSDDAQFLEKLQSFLAKVKNVLGSEKKIQFRRNYESTSSDIQFSDFFYAVIEILKGYNDPELHKFFEIIDEELRMYHYKGCKFHELIDNKSMKKFMNEQLAEMKSLPPKKIRLLLNQISSGLKTKKLFGSRDSLLDFLDTLYGRGTKYKFREVLDDLRSFPTQSNASAAEQRFLIRNGVRTLIFDHYSKLSAHARHDLKVRLEAQWENYANRRRRNKELKDKIFQSRRKTFEDSFDHAYSLVRKSAQENAAKNDDQLFAKKKRGGRKNHPNVNKRLLFRRATTKRVRLSTKKKRLNTLALSSTMHPYTSKDPFGDWFSKEKQEYHHETAMTPRLVYSGFKPIIDVDLVTETLLKRNKKKAYKNHKTKRSKSVYIDRQQREEEILPINDGPFWQNEEKIGGGRKSNDKDVFGKDEDDPESSKKYKDEDSSRKRNDKDTFPQTKNKLIRESYKSIDNFTSRIENLEKTLRKVLQRVKKVSTNTHATTVEKPKRTTPAETARESTKAPNTNTSSTLKLAEATKSKTKSKKTKSKKHKVKTTTLEPKTTKPIGEKQGTAEPSTTHRNISSTPSKTPSTTPSIVPTTTPNTTPNTTLTTTTVRPSTTKTTNENTTITTTTQIITEITTNLSPRTVKEKVLVGKFVVETGHRRKEPIIIEYQRQDNSHKLANSTTHNVIKVIPDSRRQASNIDNLPKADIDTEHLVQVDIVPMMDGDSNGLVDSESTSPVNKESRRKTNIKTKSKENKGDLEVLEDVKSKRIEDDELKHVHSDKSKYLDGNKPKRKSKRLKDGRPKRVDGEKLPKMTDPEHVIDVDETKHLLSTVPKRVVGKSKRIKKTGDSRHQQKRDGKSKRILDNESKHIVDDEFTRPIDSVPKLLNDSKHLIEGETKRIAQNEPKVSVDGKVKPITESDPKDRELKRSVDELKHPLEAKFLGVDADSKSLINSESKQIADNNPKNLVDDRLKQLDSTTENVANITKDKVINLEAVNKPIYDPTMKPEEIITPIVNSTVVVAVTVASGTFSGKAPNASTVANVETNII